MRESVTIRGREVVRERVCITVSVRERESFCENCVCEREREVVRVRGKGL